MSKFARWVDELWAFRDMGIATPFSYKTKRPKHLRSVCVCVGSFIGSAKLLNRSFNSHLQFYKLRWKCDAVRSESRSWLWSVQLTVNAFYCLLWCHDCLSSSWLMNPVSLALWSKISMLSCLWFCFRINRHRNVQLWLRMTAIQILVIFHGLRLLFISRVILFEF